MKVNDRVFVPEVIQFGTVMEIFIGEFYPVQILLDSGQLYRCTVKELQPCDEVKPGYFTGTSIKIENIKVNSYLSNRCYKLQDKTGNRTHFFTWTMDDQFLGCYDANYFEDLQELISEQHEEQTDSEPVVIELIEQDDGQLALF